MQVLKELKNSHPRCMPGQLQKKPQRQREHLTLQWEGKNDGLGLVQMDTYLAQQQEAERERGSSGSFELRPNLDTFRLTKENKMFCLQASSEGKARNDSAAETSHNLFS